MPPSAMMPRPGSPVVRSSILITSAPRSASIIEPTGPCCQMVQSITRMPWRGRGIAFPVLMASLACGSLRGAGTCPPLAWRRWLTRQPGEFLRLAAGARVDHHVDDRRHLLGHRLLERARQRLGRVGEPALAAEALDHLLVARAYGVRRRRHVRAVERVEAAAYAVVVDDHGGDRQAVAAHGLDFHAGEAEG